MQNQVIHSHTELIVWQRGMELLVAIYALSGHFPREETYGLSSQMRRAAVSIPSNIAEGRSRGTRKDFLQFLRIALGSSAELSTQIEASKRLPFGEKLDYNKVDLLLSEVTKMLRAMIIKMNPKASEAPRS